MTVNEVTQLIHQWQAGDDQALERLTPFIYDELKRLAHGYMRRESAGHTLQATALVNEAFLRFSNAKLEYSSRSHFVAAAAKMMRRILVDHARTRNSRKHGGGSVKATLHEEFVADQRDTPAILEVDMALEKLSEMDPNLASAVELVFFGGLTYEEAADHLGMGRTRFYEDLSFAKAWLKTEMG